MASAWEIAIEVGMGKLPLSEPVDTDVASQMRRLGAKYLDVVFPDACMAKFPLLHRDPAGNSLIGFNIRSK